MSLRIVEGSLRILEVFLRIVGCDPASNHCSRKGNHGFGSACELASALVCHAVFPYVSAAGGRGGLEERGGIVVGSLMIWEGSMRMGGGSLRTLVVCQCDPIRFVNVTKLTY